MGNDFFNEISETLSKTAQGLGERVGSMYETQKLRSRILGEERSVEKAMADIGRAIFEKYVAGETLEEGLAAICEEIQEHLNVIDTLKGDAASKKGKKICPACKKAVDLSACYCSFCGAKVPDPEPEAEETVEEETAEDTAAEEIAEEAADGAEELAEEAADAVEELAEAVEEKAEEAAEAVEEIAEKVEAEITEE